MRHTKIKIAFLYHDFRVGGAEKELLAYMESLSKEVYEIHLCLTTANGELFNSIPEHIQVHEVGGNSYIPDLRHIFRLYFLLWNIRPLVVVGAIQDINFNMLLLKHIFGLQYKTIATEHIILSDWQKHDKTHWLKKLLIKYFYRRADACVVQTHAILDDLKNSFGVSKNKLYIIPNYVNPYKRECTGEMPLIIKEQSPYFLYVGRITRQKNIGVLLHAYSRIFLKFGSSCPNLFLIGPHKHAHIAHMCNRLHIQNHVFIKGFDNNPWVYYENAYLTIIPSLVEGRCRVMIEAMMTRCPVVTSNFPGHEEYIADKKEGLVFNRTSAEDLADKLSYCLNHPMELNRMANAAKIRIYSIYNKDFYKEYPLLFESVIVDILGDK